MIDIAQSIHEAIAERNYTASSHLLNHVFRENRIPELIADLEAMEEEAEHLTLELRDHLFHYLEMWDIYFAVQIPSIDILRILLSNNVEKEPQVFMTGFIRDLVNEKDPKFSQFCINVDTISRGQYAILVPPILEQRIEELASCKIQYRESPSALYCTAELLETYYGNKIVSAIHDHRSFDIVVPQDQFTIINESLSTTGLDTASMLVAIEPDSWDDFVQGKRTSRVRPGGSGELSILHRVKSARSNIYSPVFRQQTAALNAINLSRTQLCNDTLMSVASDPTHQMRQRALNQLGESGDSVTMNFLADIMQNDAIEQARTEAARAYSALASRSQLSGISHSLPLPSAQSNVIDITKITNIVNTILAKGMPTTMIDDTLNSLAIQGGPASIRILTRLLVKPQLSVRRAVIKASRSLDHDTAAIIIRRALRDDSPEIVAMAEKELDTRWPDAVWD